MTSTIIIPNEAMLFVLPIPPSYIGKEVEVTFALVDVASKSKTEMKLSEKFRGVLSQESAESFMKHIKTMRNEWTDI